MFIRRIHQDMGKMTTVKFTLFPLVVLLLAFVMVEQALGSSVKGETNCPGMCTCEKEGFTEVSSGTVLQSPSNGYLPVVICHSKNLTGVPTGIPRDAKKLDLSWNNISSVLAISLDNVYKLQDMSLEGNKLQYIDAGAFANCTQLKKLTLARNKLKELPSEDAFPQSLEILNLEHNKISKLEGRVLVKNRLLRALLLGHNMIEEIAPDAFEFLTSLTILELNNNRLQEVPSSALRKLSNLQELNLAHNFIKRIDIPFHNIVPNVVLLQVKDNPMEYIHPNGFSHLHRLNRLILSNVPNLTFPHLNGTSSLEILRIDRCHLQKIPENLCEFTPNLKSLDLKLTNLQKLSNFSSCTELRILDLNGNNISEIGSGSFEALSKVHDLHIQKNRIRRIESEAFRGLSSLRVLDLSFNAIEDIDAGAFLHVATLQDLNLNDNKFPTLPSIGLDRLVDLKVHNNPNLKEFPGPESLRSVRRLSVSYAYHCCPFMGERVPGPDTELQESVFYDGTDSDFGNSLDIFNWSWPGFSNLTVDSANDFWRKFTTNEDSSGGENSQDSPKLRVVTSSNNVPHEITCTPRPGPFLPCSDLFDWWTLRCGVWIVFLLALMGNGTVVFVLIFARTKMDVPRFLVCNLAVADFFMGVYLGFLAVVDAATLGEFRRFAIKWQLSSACQVAGFFGVLSSELSVFTLAVITMERHYAITHAMHLNKRLSLRHASYIMVVGWMFALVMAVLPLLGISDYRKFAVCLPFETETPASLGYVVFLMFANGVAFTILMGCYLKMYCSIRGSQAWNSNDTRIAKRMALLVFTDLLCWFPIAFFSLTAVFGWQLVSLEEAKVFTVFILPLNSCCNPFLYAILTKQFKKDCVLICKAIEESRVTRGIGRCRHSSNFSNRQTAPNTGSLTEKSSKDGQPCICHSGLHPNGGDVNGNAKYRFIHSPERLRTMGPVGRFFSKYIFCHQSKETIRKKEEDYRMRNVRRYLYNTAQSNYPPDAGDGKHQRHASVSSDNFSSSRSDSWRIQNRCGIPLRMIEPRRRNSWAVTRKPSQDSNLSSSRNDSSATSNSTATWRLSRSSVSSDAASHSGGGKSSFKRISSASGGGAGGVRSPMCGVKSTLPTGTAAVAAAAAAAAVATGSAAATDLGAITAMNPAILAAAGALSSLTTNSEEEMATLTRTNTIKNQNPAPVLTGSPPQLPGKAVVDGSALSATKSKPAKKRKKKVKLKKQTKKDIVWTTTGKVSGGGNSAGTEPHPEIDEDEIEDEEASAKIATNRPRLVRQSAFFSDEVVIEPEVCPVHGPLNPGTYDDEDEEEFEDSESEDDEDDDEDENDEEEEKEISRVSGIVSSHHSIVGGNLVAGVICEEDEEDEEEDPTSPILKPASSAPGSSQVASIALVIVPRRHSTVRSRDAVSEDEQTAFIRSSGSANSINKQGGSSPRSVSPSRLSPSNPTPVHFQQPHSSTNSPPALLLPAGMAHFGRRKMSEQPVKFYVVPATTSLLSSAKWHSMSHVDNSGDGSSETSFSNQPRVHHYQSASNSPNSAAGTALGYPSSPSSLRSNKPQHSRSHSPRQFPRMETARRLSSSIAETDETSQSSHRQENPDNFHQSTSPKGTSPTDTSLNERRVSFQLPLIDLPSLSASRAHSPPERISSPNTHSTRDSNS